MTNVNDLQSMERFIDKKIKPLNKQISMLQIELSGVKQQLSIPFVSKRYDANKYTPPFRVGRKQGKAVLDCKGIQVAFFMHSEEQSKMYCDYLNDC
jgi:hypothetical protein